MIRNDTSTMHKIYDLVTTNPFGCKPKYLYYQNGEIERVINYHSSLFKVSLFNASTTEFENFIERQLPESLSIDIEFMNYADLEDEVLGDACFYPDHILIRINRTLTEGADAGYKEHTYYETLAHEAAHCLLHKRLFDLVCQANYETIELITNRKTGDFEYLTSPSHLLYHQSYEEFLDWLEAQTEIGMDSITMPKELFLRECRVITGCCSNSY